MKKLNHILGYLIGIVFFLVGLVTLSDYGLNVDEPIHFIRGQAYLNYLLTGRDKYGQSELDQERVSAWKYPQYDASYFLKKDTGHPSLNDIGGAIFNRLFYEKLGIIGDLESYHLFELFVSTVLVIFIYYVVSNKFGMVPGIVSALSLFLYPLFFAESKFNIKDPIETTFFSFSLYYLYSAFIEAKIKLLFVGIISFAFALGTKFNILFLPFILIPPIFMFFYNKYKFAIKKVIGRYSKSFYLLLMVSPIMILGVYLLSRPYVWADPITRIIETLTYYKDIGIGNFADNRFIIAGWNVYAPYYVLITTPPIIILLATTGIIFSIIKLIIKRDQYYLLILLWLLIPIVRVMVPGTTIYSGVRQIMEYIPALAIFSGLGFYVLNKFIKQKSKLLYYLFLFGMVAGFVHLAATLFKLHPNENVYFNSIVGGVSGAYNKKVPGTGETMGNIYLQGLDWLNKNAEAGSRFGTAVGLRSNIPIEKIRKDIDFGPHISGMDRQGEYMIEKVSIGFPPKDNFYIFNYLNKFLIPVYEVRVDNVSLLKVWKNDVDNTRKGYLDELIFSNIPFSKNSSNSLVIKLPEVRFLTKLVVNHNNRNCISRDKTQNYIEYSSDGVNWSIPESIDSPQGPRATALQRSNKMIYYFAADRAQFIRISSDSKESCLLSARRIDVFYLKDLE